jgi:hypothetical protein
MTAAADIEIAMEFVTKSASRWQAPTGLWTNKSSEIACNLIDSIG